MLRQAMRKATFWAAAAVVTAAAGTAPGAVTYSVRAIADVQSSGNITNAQAFHTDTGNVAALSVEAGPLNASSGGDFYSFLAAAHVRTEVGAVHGSVSASANSRGPAGGGTASAQGLWSDSITITSATLPNGAPVQFAASVTLHRTLGGSAGFGRHASASVTGPFGLNLTDTLDAPNATQTVSTLVSTFVGQTLSASSSVQFQADASGVTQPFNNFASVEAENTVTFSFVPITPGASYTTASGAVFVPEPGVAASGMAVGLMALRRRRR